MCPAVSAHAASDAEKARQVFHHFDSDKSGELDRAEQQILCDKMVTFMVPTSDMSTYFSKGSAAESEITSAKMMESLKFMDTNKNGKVDFNEFNQGFSGQTKGSTAYVR